MMPSGAAGFAQLAPGVGSKVLELRKSLEPFGLLFPGRLGIQGSEMDCDYSGAKKSSYHLLELGSLVTPG